MENIIEKCLYCKGSGHIEKHQYMKAKRGAFRCICGEPLVSDKHFDRVGSWDVDETWQDKEMLQTLPKQTHDKRR